MQRLVTPGEKMPALSMPDIEAFGVNPQQPLHADHQVGLRSFDHQVEVIAHQAKGMHLPLRLLTRLLQSGQKALAVQIVLENILPAVATVDHVVNRSRILHAQFAGHPATLPRTAKSVNSED